MAAAGLMLYPAAVFLNKREHVFILLTAADIFIFAPVVMSGTGAVFWVSVLSIVFFMNLIILDFWGEEHGVAAKKQIFDIILCGAACVSFVFIILKKSFDFSAVYLSADAGVLVFLVFLFLAGAYAVFAAEKRGSDG